MSDKKDFFKGVLVGSESGRKVVRFIPESLQTLFFDALWEFLLEHGLVYE